MTSEEIKAYNDQFLRYETKEYETMTDIVKMLKIIHADTNGDYGSSSVHPNASIVAGEAIAEIEWLRSEVSRLRATAGEAKAVFGLAIEGKPFSDIKKEIRGG